MSKNIYKVIKSKINFPHKIRRVNKLIYLYYINYLVAEVIEGWKLNTTKKINWNNHSSPFIKQSQLHYSHLQHSYLCSKLKLLCEFFQFSFHGRSNLKKACLTLTFLSLLSSAILVTFISLRILNPMLLVAENYWILLKLYVFFRVNSVGVRILR